MKTKINLPTKITISRIVLSFLLILTIFLIYIFDEFKPFVNKANIYLNNDGTYVNYIMIILFGIFLLTSLTDFLDGYLARKNNEVTDLGKFLDPIADKMLVNSMLIFLSINFKSISNSHSSIPFFCVILMIIRDLIVDGLRLMAANKQIVISANIFGKLKTVFQMITISLVMLNGFPFNLLDNLWMRYLHISDIMCYITTIISLLSGTIYITKNIHVIIGGKNNE